MDELQPASHERDRSPSGLFRRISACSSLPPGFAPLRLVLQPSGATLELMQPDVLVGRHSSADVRLPLPDVSRRHCRLVFGKGCWQVIDLHSLNGIYLNDQPISQGTLEAGDLLRIGGFTFLVALDPPQVHPSESLILSIFRPGPGGTLPRRAS
jgi:pSer/pThr/pTyr-binding forkhead associated (FHA) protein